MLIKTDVMVYLRPPSGFQPQFSAVGTFCTVDHHFLLLRRASGSTHPGCWGIPGGKLCEDEAPYKGAERELFEETGIHLNCSDIIPRQTYFVTGPDQSFVYHIFSAGLSCRPHIKLNAREHTEYSWRTPSDSLRLPLVDGLQLCIHDQQHLLNSHRLPSLNELEALTDWKLLKHAEPHSATPAKWWASIGPPASGKTTSLNAIAAALPKLMVVGCPEILDPGSRLRFLLNAAFVEQQHDAFFPFQMELIKVQFNRIRSLGKHSLIDESVYSSLAYSRALYDMGWISHEEYLAFYSEFVRLHSGIRAASGIFYFDCPISVIEKRLMQRIADEPGRSHEALYDPIYISTLCEAFARTAIELSSAIDVARLDTSINTPKLIAERCFHFFNTSTQLEYTNINQDGGILWE